MEASIPTPAPPQADGKPNFLLDVARVCGIEVARTVQARFGGSRVYVPLHPQPHHVLCKAIGVENAQRIAIEVGAGSADIPLGEAGAIATRRANIEQRLMEGQGADLIARACKCSSRAVHIIRKRLRKEGKL